MNHFVIEEIEPKALAEGVVIRMVSGEKLSMVFYWIKPGSPIPEHSHPHEQIGTVLKGKIELSVGEDKRTVGPGEVYHIPSNVPHSGRCLETESEVMEVFSPPREDFLALPGIKG
ncbi:cupin domain-containing protein [Thermodesulfobacteriota bacterium]